MKVLSGISWGHFFFSWSRVESKSCRVAVLFKQDCCSQTIFFTPNTFFALCVSGQSDNPFLSWHLPISWLSLVPQERFYFKSWLTDLSPVSHMWLHKNLLRPFTNLFMYSGNLTTLYLSHPLPCFTLDGIITHNCTTCSFYLTGIFSPLISLFTLLYPFCPLVNRLLKQSFLHTQLCSYFP